MKYIDFHTHILHEIDDGAKDILESLEMLKTAKLCGAETVVLTPHYKSEVPVSEFCELRSLRLSALKSAMSESEDEYPKILVGAEVLISGAISEIPDIKKLCIEGTNLLLLELPYTTWNKWHFNEVYNTAVKYEITPVMAHIERYLSSPKDIEKLETLVAIGAKFQVNAESFASCFGKRVIRALAAEGLISAIGSDCHNLFDRSPDISKPLKLFAKKFGDSFIDYLYKKSSDLLSIKQ